MSEPISLDSLKKLFPGASLSTLKRNSGVADAVAQPRTVTKRLAQQLSVLADPVDQPVCNPGSLTILPSTDEAKLNKNERAYLAWMRTHNDFWIGIQSITLKLAHDCRYTPDFWALDAAGMRAIDCKGVKRDGSLLIWEDSKIKMKVAARMFPMFRFLIAHKDGGNWQHTEIKP